MQVADVELVRGERILLRPLRFENIHKYFQWNNDAELNHLDDEVGHVKESFGEFKARFERLIYHPSPRDKYFEICTTDGQLIGVAYAVGISLYNKNCLAGVTIGERSTWGNGFGRESLGLLLRYCFDELGLHRVSAETFAYNSAWDDLVKAMGFRHEGVRRDHLLRDGRFHDRHEYGLLEDEYRSFVLQAKQSEHDNNGERT